MADRELTMVSLFSGIGGMDQGLHDAGFRSLFCCELDKHARASLLGWHNHAGLCPIVAEDVQVVSPTELRRGLGLAKGELDLLAGGPPCQSFSLIGKRKSVEDPRGLLLFQMVRFAAELLPKAILIEQVKGLKSALGAQGKKGGALAFLQDSLEALGYEVSFRVLKAADYGVPQNRERLFVVGTQKGLGFHFPSATHANPKKMVGHQTHSMPFPPYRTVFDAIHDLPLPTLKGVPEEFPNHIDATPARDRERIHGVPEGKYLANQLHLPAEQRMRLNPQKDTTKFRRLSWSEPSLTLRGGEAFYHPVEDRYITPREALRLHGFSDEMKLEGPIRGRSGTFRNLDQHRQVANAVPPKLAEVLGKAIASFTTGRSWAR